MTKIFFYELRRLLLHKFFWGLLVITLVYTYPILEGELILGVANTAPFSAWSYGYYLSKCLPLLLLTLSFFVSSLYSKKEKKVQVIIRTTPVDMGVYRGVRCLTILCGLVILSLAVLAPSFIFYSTVFQFSSFADFFLPISLTLIPVTIFVFGTGMFFGRYSSALQYVVVLLVLLTGFSFGPEFSAAFDLLSTNFYASYPLGLPLGVNGEPAFTLPASFLIQKLVITLIGLVFGAYALRKDKS